MNASQSEAESEYSTGPEGENGPRGPRRGHPAVGLLVGLAGVVLLAVAEFTTLLKVTTVAAHPRLLRTIQAGPHHGWAELVIAALAALLIGSAWRTSARAPLVALALAGLASLGVALLGDLPDVHSHGLVGSPAVGLHEAQTRAAIGLYLETLGAICLLLGAGAAALLGNHLRS